jgi:hypothetical protein
VIPTVVVVGEAQPFTKMSERKRGIVARELKKGRGMKE